MKKRESISRGEAAFRTPFPDLSNSGIPSAIAEYRYKMQRYTAGYRNYARAMEYEGFGGRAVQTFLFSDFRRLPKHFERNRFCGDFRPLFSNFSRRRVSAWLTFPYGISPMRRFYFGISGKSASFAIFAESANLDGACRRLFCRPHFSLPNCKYGRRNAKGAPPKFPQGHVYSTQKFFLNIFFCGRFCLYFSRRRPTTACKSAGNSPALKGCFLRAEKFGKKSLLF